MPSVVSVVGERYTQQPQSILHREHADGMVYAQVKELADRRTVWQVAAPDSGRTVGSYDSQRVLVIQNPQRQILAWLCRYRLDDQLAYKEESSRAEGHWADRIIFGIYSVLYLALWPPRAQDRLMAARKYPAGHVAPSHQNRHSP